MEDFDLEVIRAKLEADCANMEYKGIDPVDQVYMIPEFFHPAQITPADVKALIDELESWYLSEVPGYEKRSTDQ
jgi:hypothetical protein